MVSTCCIDRLLLEATQGTLRILIRMTVLVVVVLTPIRGCFLLDHDVLRYLVVMHLLDRLLASLVMAHALAILLFLGLMKVSSAVNTGYGRL